MAASGDEGRAALVDGGGVQGGVVDHQLPVDPHPHGLVGGGGERVALGVARLDRAGPARGEAVGGDQRRRGAAEPPGVVDGRVGPDDRRGAGEIGVVPVRRLEPGAGPDRPGRGGDDVGLDDGGDRVGGGPLGRKS